MANLKKHIMSDKFKWIITLLVGIILIGAVIGLSVQLSRQTSTTVIGGEAYSIGALDEDGKVAESDASIYTRKAVKADGIKCELADEAEITYQLFFYDEDGKFLSSSTILSADYDSSTIPEGAESVKVVITPTADEDGKISLVEVLGYAEQLKVIVKK